MQNEARATHFNKFSDRQNFKNELIAGAVLVGKYGLPALKRNNSIPRELVPFNKAKTEQDTAHKWVHFFIDDYQFERLWNFPKRYLDLLSRFEGVITPDFSMFASMPKAQQIWNSYRNRAIAYWLQNNGISIIPTVEWAEYSDLEWCLEGLPLNSSLALGTYGVQKQDLDRYGLIKGIEKICKELSPESLIIYGSEITSVNSLCKNVVWIENYCKGMKKRL
jgi:hypothetical protein